MKPKISLICLGVSDIARSIAFYHQGLGFELHNYTPGDDHVMFRLEGTWLSLYPSRLLAEDAGVAEGAPGPQRITLAHNAPSPEAVDAAFALALAAGAAAVKTPQTVFWGGYSGYFADPDGFLWEVAHNPFTDLT